ncbi:hypothetical protein NIES4102_43240 (plasmid) [Chondrocystis sp. NIES-4102]|nr:hypothetical protein NIES4102_43240 [Chondrocystis sp. NIES-4102]
MVLVRMPPLIGGISPTHLTLIQGRITKQSHS